MCFEKNIYVDVVKIVLFFIYDAWKVVFEMMESMEMMIEIRQCAWTKKHICSQKWPERNPELVYFILRDLLGDHDRKYRYF